MGRLDPLNPDALPIDAYGLLGDGRTALAVPLVGFLPVDDPRVTATVKAVRDQLEDDGLLYRYL